MELAEVSLFSGLGEKCFCFILKSYLDFKYYLNIQSLSVILIFERTKNKWLKHLLRIISLHLKILK